VIVVISEGFPLTYEVLDGNRNDVTTLDAIVNAVRERHGAQGRVRVFDRGIVSEEKPKL
jgi:transposase